MPPKVGDGGKADETGLILPHPATESDPPTHMWDGSGWHPLASRAEMPPVIERALQAIEDRTQKAERMVGTSSDFMKGTVHGLRVAAAILRDCHKENNEG